MLASSMAEIESMPENQGGSDGYTSCSTGIS